MLWMMDHVAGRILMKFTLSVSNTSHPVFLLSSQLLQWILFLQFCSHWVPAELAQISAWVLELHSAAATAAKSLSVIGKVGGWQIVNAYYLYEALYMRDAIRSGITRVSIKIY